MTNDVFAKIRAAQKVVNELTDGVRQWTLSIPARTDHDPDIVIGDALEAARAELAALTADKANLLKALTRVRSLVSPDALGGQQIAIIDAALQPPVMP